VIRKLNSVEVEVTAKKLAQDFVLSQNGYGVNSKKISFFYFLSKKIFLFLK